MLFAFKFLQNFLVVIWNNDMRRNIRYPVDNKILQISGNIRRSAVIPAIEPIAGLFLYGFRQ